MINGAACMQTTVPGYPRKIPLPGDGWNGFVRLYSVHTIMKVLGIKKSSGIELTDSTIQDNSIIPAHCPGSLAIACTTCSHAWKPGIVRARREGRTAPPVTFFVCRWHEADPSGETTEPS